MSQLLSCCLSPILPPPTDLPPCPQGPGSETRKGKGVSGPIQHTSPQATALFLQMSLCPAVSQNDQRWDGGGGQNNVPGISDSISCKLCILNGCSGLRLARQAPLIALQTCFPSALSPDSGNVSRRHLGPLGGAGSWVISAEDVPPRPW